MRDNHPGAGAFLHPDMTVGERAARLMSRVNVYVPRPDSAAAAVIAPGSGVVGYTLGAGVLLYYEGNLIGASNIVTFADRVMHAHDRLAIRYPTSAMLHAEPDEVDCAGAYDPKFGLVSIDHPEVLQRWLGAAYADNELMTSEGPGFRRRMMTEMVAGYRDLAPEVQVWLRQEAARLGVALPPEVEGQGG